MEFEVPTGGQRARPMRVFLLLCGIVFLTPVAQAQSTRVDAAVVHVRWHNPKTNMDCCGGTAFHVGRGMFYTNAHVIRGHPQEFTELWLFNAQRNRWVGPAEVACVDDRWAESPTPRSGELSPYDVALIRVVGADYPALRFSGQALGLGLGVRIVGYPVVVPQQRPSQYVAEGYIIEVDSERFTVKILDGFGIPGSSGSPVLTATGEILGIVYGGIGSEYAVAATQSTILSGCR